MIILPAYITVYIRLVMSTGLDILINLAEGADAAGLEAKAAQSRRQTSRRGSTRSNNIAKYSLSNISIDERSEDEDRESVSSRGGGGAGGKLLSRKSVAAAVDLLQVIGPYNYILCTNCGSREPGGDRCSLCGYRIKFEAVTTLDKVV